MRKHKYLKHVQHFSKKHVKPILLKNVKIVKKESQRGLVLKTPYGQNETNLSNLYEKWAKVP